MKQMNEYARALDARVYERCPKAVFAAIAVSALTAGGDQLDEATELVLKEWRVLHQNGIVQRGPRKGG